MNEDFDKLIASHSYLDLFLNKKELKLVSDFTDFSVPNEAFLEYVSPRFLASFESELDAVGVSGLAWKLPNLYKLRRVCNMETAKKCDDMIVDFLKLNNKLVEDFIASSQKEASEFVKIKKSFGLAISEAYNHLPENHKDIREEYGLFCAKLVKSMEPGLDEKGLKGIKDEQIELFGEVLNASVVLNLNNELKGALITFKEEFTKKYEEVLKKETGKANIWIVITVVIIVIRILMFIARSN